MSYGEILITIMAAGGIVPLDMQGLNIWYLATRQNGHHFPDNIFKWIFLNKNGWILITISVKFVPEDPINNIPALV